MNAKVAGVMSTNVIAVRENASFKEIAAKLRDQRISAFPVIDEDSKVIGVVSEADLIAKEVFEDDGGEDNSGPPSGLIHRRDLEKAKGVTARELMSQPAVTVWPDDTVRHAARLMYDRRVKRLPVVDGAGRLVGIVSRTDVLTVYNRPDQEIYHQITDVIRQEFRTDPLSYRVTVQDGVVTLAGEPETAAIGQEIVGAVRHIESVVAVRDRLEYPGTDLHPYGPRY